MGSAHLLSFSSDGQKWQTNTHPSQHLGLVQIFTPGLICPGPQLSQHPMHGKPCKILLFPSSRAWLPSRPNSHLAHEEEELKLNLWIQQDVLAVRSSKFLPVFKTYSLTKMRCWSVSNMVLDNIPTPKYLFTASFFAYKWALLYVVYN